MQGTVVAECMPGVHQRVNTSHSIRGCMKPSAYLVLHSTMDQLLADQRFLSSRRSYLLPPCPSSVSRTTYGLSVAPSLARPALSPRSSDCGATLSSGAVPTRQTLRPSAVTGAVSMWRTRTRLSAMVSTGHSQGNGSCHHVQMPLCRQGQGAYRWLPSQKVAAVLVRSSLVAITQGCRCVGKGRALIGSCRS